MSQSLKICFHATPVTGTTDYRHCGKWSIDQKPGLSAVEVHYKGSYDVDDGDNVGGDDDEARS